MQRSSCGKSVVGATRDWKEQHTLNCLGLKVTWASSVLGLTLALASVGVPVLAEATDIAWHSTTKLTYQNGSNFRREGTATFKTGERASFVGDGTSYMIDDKGMAPFKVQYMLRFNDGSTFTIRFNGSRHQFEGTTRGSGEFVNGTGRFDGIVGTVSHTGQIGGSEAEGDWVGSYSLPKQ
jgi:hypothetical protein